MGPLLATRMTAANIRAQGHIQKQPIPGGAFLCLLNPPFLFRCVRAIRFQPSYHLGHSATVDSVGTKAMHLWVREVVGLLWRERETMGDSGGTYRLKWHRFYKAPTFLVMDA
jgi:hypothetical protein